MPHLTSIIHPEALLYHHFLGPRIPLPDDDNGTTWVEEEETIEE